MSKKKNARNHTPEEEKSSKNGLNRRNFLGLAGAAAAAPLLVNPLTAEAKEAPFEEEKAAAGTCTKCPVSNPSQASETWDEPWVWEPHKWPNETLHLNVIEHQTPSTIVGLGNPNAALFAYNGATPGPTIRMKGDETLRVKLFNHLGLNQGSTPIGLDTDPAYYPAGDDGNKVSYDASKYSFREDWTIGEHVNGIHSIHTTNLHTHGLHVRPGLNTDGTHSDNIYLRVIPQADLETRETDPGYNGNFLLEGEQAGEATYEFRLGQNNGHKIAKHPPGTHWYHPHSHGSTNMEVASGMAGFLVVEGDVDNAINQYMLDPSIPIGQIDPEKEANFNPTLKSGPFNYRERMMMLQRVLVPAVDQDANRKGLKNGATPATNGSPLADIITMNEGDVERWRVLNGSVDGKGYVRFMVLKGQWVSEKPTKGTTTLSGNPRPSAFKGKGKKLTNMQKRLNSVKQLLYVDSNTGKRYLPTTEQISNAKQQLYQLAQDGVTLVKEDGNQSKYYIKDLKNDQVNPLYQDYSNLADCYKNPETLKACYNLSNELYMAPANRADFIFEAPASTQDYEVYTVIAKGTAIHTENEERIINMYDHYTSGSTTPGYMQPPNNNLSVPGDTIMAYIVVQKEGNNGTLKSDIKKPQFNINNLMKVVSSVPVPEYLSPITADEVRVKKGDVDQGKNNGNNVGKYRTRQVTYSGWGAATWPILDPTTVVPFDAARGGHGTIPDNIIWKPQDYLGLPKAPTKNGTVVAPSSTKSMAIDNMKFNPDDPNAPRPILNTSEEWVVYNQSISLFGAWPDSPGGNNASAKAFDIDHRIGYPITRAEAQKRKYNITTRGIDHPFHIHTNPFWLMRVEVPDENGNLVNILPEPRWHDVMWIPRNGGRIVFRSRFPDFVGKMVNHCHILQHEDNGMMQEVLITPSVENGNYVASAKVSNTQMAENKVSALGAPYTPETPEQAYKRCSHVMDMNHMDSPDMPLAYEYPTKNGAFEAPSLPPLKK